MGVVFQAGYAPGSGDEPIENARILHCGRSLSGGSVVDSSTEIGFFASGPLNALTYERWKPGAVPAQWEYDHGAVASADCFCIAAHTAGTAGATLDLQYFDGADWVTLVSVSPEDDAPIMALFEPISASAWRVEVTGYACEIGVIRIGLALQVPTAIYSGQSPLTFGRKVAFRSTRSETGQFLGRTKQRVALSGAFGWSHLPSAWVYANWGEFQRAAEDEPFFLAWRPAEFSEVGYCDADQVPAPAFMGISDLMSVEVSVTGLASI
ncbi:MAG: hypothetical protein IE919_10000 [Thioclava sp.]|nr:hypothetical protein [Thioclava sp.]MBD3803556.1 hypothetical protein [Thioclava sp.]